MSGNGNRGDRTRVNRFNDLANQPVAPVPPARSLGVSTSSQFQSATANTIPESQEGYFMLIYLMKQLVVNTVGDPEEGVEPNEDFTLADFEKILNQAFANSNLTSDAQVSPQIRGHIQEMRDYASRAPSLSKEERESQLGGVYASVYTSSRSVGGPVARQFDRVLDIIAKTESGADRTRSYDISHGSKILLTRSGNTISRSTVDDVIALQDKIVADAKRNGDESASSAMGRYQFMGFSLKELKAKGVVRGDEIFSAETQDRLAIHQFMIKRDGWKLLSGDGNINAALDRMAYEWAGVPGADGRGKYDGDKAGNRANSGVAQEMRAALTDLRDTYRANAGNLEITGNGMVVARNEPSQPGTLVASNIPTPTGRVS